MRGYDETTDWQAIGLEGLEVEMRVGAFDQERGRTQRVRIAVTMYRGVGGHRGGLEGCLDYDRVFRHLTGTWPSRPHTDLLEELAEDLLAFCFEDQRVEACRVRLSKPDAFGGRADPVVEINRRRRP